MDILIQTQPQTNVLIVKPDLPNTVAKQNTLHQDVLLEPENILMVSASLAIHHINVLLAHLTKFVPLALQDGV